MNPGNGDVDLVREIAAETLEILLCILCEEEACRHFHRQDVGMARTVLTQPSGRGRDGLRQPAVIGVPQFFNDRCDGGDMFTENWQ